MSDDDFLVFAEEDCRLGRMAESDRTGENRTRRWKVAVIDDDPAVHDGTRYALSDYSLNGQEIEVLHAGSAAEGRALMAAHPDVAVVLLDVVMETETAGLELVDYIRRTLRNEFVRIILRTGQPGQAPERRVIVEHDINDYKAKTELTSEKLFTALTAALRAHQQLLKMEDNRRGLEIIIDAASALFDTRSMRRFAEGVLTQVASLLEVDCAGMLVVRQATCTHAEVAVLAGSGVYAPLSGICGDDEDLDQETRRLLDTAFAEKRHCFFDRRSVLYIHTSSGREIAVILDAAKHLSATDRALVEVFCGKLSVAFENVLLYEELQASNAALEARVVARTEELTRSNRRLDDQREMLRRANAFKVDLLGMIAHDLKNPLAAVLGRAEILTELLERPVLPRDVLKEQVAKLVAPARAMTRMIGDLVGQATADAIDITIKPAVIDLVALALDVVDHMRPVASRKDQSIVCTHEGSISAWADPDRMRDAVENLVVNAIKYGPVGGRIDVAVRTTLGRAILTVTDQGPGLAPEDFERLFCKFQRLSAQPTGGESSTGLGLFIARQIVEMHGGRISAFNGESGVGTTFEITLLSHIPDRASSNDDIATASYMSEVWP